MIQKTPVQKTILRWVISVHVVLILVAVILPLFQKLIRPKKKEIITFVAIENESIPNPVPEIQPVEVESLPEPKAVEIPIQTNTPPKKVEKPEKPKPKPEPKKPKWKAAPVVRQNKRIIKDSKKPAPVAPTRKRISASDIRNALSTGGGGGTFDPHGAYYNTVMQRMYSVWQVPVGAAYGLTARASVTVGTDGTVSNRRLIRGSGDAVFDQSVQKALNTVNRLPRPPADLPSRTITIEFTPQ